MLDDSIHRCLEVRLLVRNFVPVGSFVARVWWKAPESPAVDDGGEQSTANHVNQMT